MLREGKRLLSETWRPIFLFELIVQLIGLALFVPLVGALTDGTVRLAGLRYLTKANMELLLRSVWALPLLAVLLCLAALYMLIQFTGVIVILDARQECEKLTFGGLVHEILSGLRRFFAPGRGQLLLHLLLLVPLVTSSAAGGIISAIGLPDIIGSFVKDPTLLIPVYVGIAVICLLVSVRSILALPLFICRRCSFRAARRQSRQWMRGCSVRVFFGLLLWTLLYLTMLLLILFLLTALGIGLVSLFGGAVTYGKVPLRVLRYGLLAVIWFFSAFAVPYFATGIMVYYRRLRDARHRTLRRCPSASSAAEKGKRQKRRIFSAFVGVLLLAADGIYLYRLISGENALRFALRVEPVVVAHRGASADAPENTMYAFEKAIALGADGIELDVQQTADGILVVTHDLSLKRISGLSRKVSELTYAELQRVDVGSWFDPMYAQARITSLEEVLAFVDGRVFLNIELKSDAVGEHLEEKVVDLIMAYGLEDKCCVTSFSYASLKKIKACCPDIRTGFIMSHAYGDFYHLEAVDAFSIKSIFINQQVVNNAHQSGKEVYVWTVNTVPEMQRMLNLDVDHIITDKPELLRAQIDCESTEDTLIEAVLRLTAT